MKPEDVVGDVCGFFVVICAVILLNAFKDMDVTVDDFRGIMRPKRHQIENRNSDANAFEDILVRHNNRDVRAYGTTQTRNI